MAFLAKTYYYSKEKWTDKLLTQQILGAPEKKKEMHAKQHVFI
jgi:hypothetical protein